MNNSQPLARASGLLRALASIDPTMQISTAQVLLYISHHQDKEGGLSTGELRAALGMTPATASRNSYYWADGTPAMPGSGYGMVTIHVDPMDRRRRVLRLTPKGKNFIDTLEQLVA